MLKDHKTAARSKSLRGAQIFLESLNPFCNLLHCPKYITEKSTLLSIIENIDKNLQDLPEPVLIKTPLSDSDSLDANTNTNVFNADIKYVLSTKRYEEPLFQSS